VTTENDKPGDVADDAGGPGSSFASSVNHRRAIARKITVVARQLRQLFDAKVEQLGVTRAKWILIAAVALRPGATQRMIATHLEITDVTAGRLIDRMCADGLLERRENRQDRRAYSVYLTEKAQPVLAQLMKAAEAHESEVFASFDEAELELLDSFLTRISQNLNASQETQHPQKRVGLA
jgi:MarR family transcriptional regulator for hemolysin